MSKLLANPKLFAATGLLFALATLFNYSSSSAVENSGTSLTLSPKPSAPVEAKAPAVAAEPRAEIKTASL